MKKVNLKSKFYALLVAFGVVVSGCENDDTGVFTNNPVVAPNVVFVTKPFYLDLKQGNNVVMTYTLIDQSLTVPVSLDSILISMPVISLNPISSFTVTLEGIAPITVSNFRRGTFVSNGLTSYTLPIRINAASFLNRGGSVTVAATDGSVTGTSTSGGIIFR